MRFFFFNMGSIEEDLLSDEGVSHSWLSRWGGVRKISLLPLSDRGSTAFSLFSFHLLQREPFHRDLPTVISVLKQWLWGVGRRRSVYRALCGSWSFVICWDLLALGSVCPVIPVLLRCSGSGHLLKDSSKVARILRLSHLGVCRRVWGTWGFLGASAGVISDEGGMIMLAARGPAQSPWQRGVGSHKGLKISALPGTGSGNDFKCFTAL